MIKAVVFDLGKVLVDFDPEDGMRKMGFPEDVIDSFMKNIFAELWEVCDGKNYTLDEINKVYKAAVPGYEDFVDVMWDKIPLLTGCRPYASEWIASLKDRGLKVYVLSNYGSVSFAINSKTYDFLELMDGMLISYEIELVKPDPQIYEELFKRFNIKPEEAVFIDDRAVNIEASEAEGMRGIIFESYKQASKELLGLLEV